MTDDGAGKREKDRKEYLYAGIALIGAGIALALSGLAMRNLASVALACSGVALLGCGVVFLTISRKAGAAGQEPGGPRS